MSRRHRRLGLPPALIRRAAWTYEPSGAMAIAFPGFEPAAERQCVALFVEWSDEHPEVFESWRRKIDEANARRCLCESCRGGVADS